MLSYSVVIPTKNEGKNIGRLLKSIRAQKYQPDEIIVSDDSTDNTRKIAKSYGAKIVQGVSNGLIGKGRNLGAVKVKSEYIMFLDADNELPVGFSSKFFKKVIAKNADIATPYLRPYSKKALNTLYFEGLNKIRDVSSQTETLIAESGACILVKKAYFDKVKGFSSKLKLGEDFDFVNRVRKAGAKHVVIPIYIKTSERRLEHKSAKATFLFWFGIIGATLFLVFGLKALKKEQKKFEKMYGKTGG